MVGPYAYHGDFLLVPEHDIKELAAEIERLRKDYESANRLIGDYMAKLDIAIAAIRGREQDIERLREAIRRALDWSENHQDSQMCERVLIEALGDDQ